MADRWAHNPKVPSSSLGSAITRHGFFCIVIFCHDAVSPPFV